MLLLTLGPLLIVGPLLTLESLLTLGPLLPLGPLLILGRRYVYSLRQMSNILRPRAWDERLNPEDFVVAIGAENYELADGT